jgi:hypothetical protein
MLFLVLVGAGLPSADSILVNVIGLLTFVGSCGSVLSIMAKRKKVSNLINLCRKCSIWTLYNFQLLFRQARDRYFYEGMDSMKGYNTDFDLEMKQVCRKSNLKC